MSFQTVCNQLRACIGSASVFPQGTAQISIGDDKLLAQGKTPVAVIEIQPRLQHMRESFGGGHLHIWHVPVTVSAQWRDASHGPTQLASAWQGVLDQICQNPNLGIGASGGIREAHVEAANLIPIVEEYGTKKFASVQLSVAITEDVHVTELE